MKNKKESSKVNIIILTIIFLTLINCTMKKQQVAPLYIEEDIGNYQIPDNYDSYTLFFATSYYYTENLTLKDSNNFKKSLKRFGKSIGNNNLVVWVKNPKTDGLNVEMGKTYADRLYRWYGYNLDYSSGPYLVYLTQNPNQPPNANDFAAIIGFKNKNYEDSIEAIEYLESQIRREKVKKEDVTMINYWIDLKSIARSNVDIIIDIAKNIGKK